MTLDALERARLAYQRVGRGCIVSLFEVRYATMGDLAARLGPEKDSLMLLTAISDAVERYNPKTEAVVMIESEKGFEVSIVSQSGVESVGGSSMIRTRNDAPQGRSLTLAAHLRGGYDGHVELGSKHQHRIAVFRVLALQSAARI